MLFFSEVYDSATERLMNLYFVNCLLMDYSADCSVFEDLKQQLKTDTREVRREVEIWRMLEEKGPDRAELLREGVGLLQEFGSVRISMTSRNYLDGLKRINRCFSLMNWLEHPKDLVFMSGFFKNFFVQFAQLDLFRQIPHLLSTTSEENCMIEVVKILAYIYNSLKFRNHIFNFRDLLEQQSMRELVLNKANIADLASLAGTTGNAMLLILYLLCLNSIVK